MNIEFSIKMTVIDMYRFFLRHSYYCVSGVISLLVSIAALVYLIINFEKMQPIDMLLIGFLAALFTVIMPLQLLKKAATVVKLTPTFQKPLEYKINDEGVYVSQEGEGALLPWASVFKTVLTKTQLVIYSSPKNGYIMPKNQLKDNLKPIMELIDKYKDVPFEDIDSVASKNEKSENASGNEE